MSADESFVGYPPPRPTFLGWTVYLGPAAEGLGLGMDSMDVGRKNVSLPTAGNLIAQAYTACPTKQADVLFQARRHIDGLRLAARAGEIMIATAEVQLGLAPDEPVEPEPDPIDETPIHQLVNSEPTKRPRGRPPGVKT